MKFNAKDELQKRFGGQLLWGKSQVIPKEYKMYRVDVNGVSEV